MYILSSAFSLISKTSYGFKLSANHLGRCIFSKPTRRADLPLSEFAPDCVSCCNVRGSKLFVSVAGVSVAGYLLFTRLGPDHPGACPATLWPTLPVCLHFGGTSPLSTSESLVAPMKEGDGSSEHGLGS